MEQGNVPTHDMGSMTGNAEEEEDDEHKHAPAPRPTSQTHTTLTALIDRVFPAIQSSAGLFSPRPSIGKLACLRMLRSCDGWKQARVCEVRFTVRLVRP
jgi:hypothetical protein